MFTQIVGYFADELPSGLRQHDFEVAGNYKYTLSYQEIEKAATGLDLIPVAFKGLNDAYIDADADERASRLRTKIQIRAKDALCRLGLLNHNLLVAIVLKNAPSDGERKALRASGY